jgi:hypothetical protein
MPSFTDPSRQGIGSIPKKTLIKRVNGTSELAAEHGVRGVPHAFLFGKDAKLLSQGSPADKAFDLHIVAAFLAK